MTPSSRRTAGIATRRPWDFVPTYSIDEHNRIWITDKAIDIAVATGDLLSLIPLTVCTGVSTQGLAYPLLDATLYVGQGRGVSNVLFAETANISLRSGKLLVMLCKDE